MLAALVLLSFQSFALVRDAHSLKPNDAVYLCGRRATVEAYLSREAAGRSAFAPIDGFNQLEVSITPPPELLEVTTSPGKVDKTYRLKDGGKLRAEWMVDRDRPVLRVRYTINAPSDTAAVLRFDASLVSNVGYVNKFVQHDDDACEVSNDHLVFHDQVNSNLTVAMRFGTGGHPKVTGPNSGSVSSEVALPKGATRVLELLVSGASNRTETENCLRAKRLVSFDTKLKGSCQFECPDREINRFIAACETVPIQNVRDLPFGPPFSEDGLKNISWPVVTASPDYHGIFANDCVQSMWELGLLGPSLYEASQNSIESMLRFGSHESVEWWTGNGKVWQFTYPLGNTPQVALGACWHLLWRGDKVLADKMWPDIEALLKLHDKFDTDGDGLEDRPNTPYPEQPDPSEYNHEMLYVQCFWRQAFDRASKVAEWLGKPSATRYAEKAALISASIERVFGTPYGLGVWVNAQHKPHPHIGHEQIIAAAAGDVSDDRSRRIVKTMTEAPMWTPDGPLRAEPGKGVAAGDHVWTFMRWKLVQAMLRLGDTDKAIEIAHRWAEQERSLNYQAPEAFPTVTGTTGKLYTWTAARAIRAVVIGLTGLELGGREITFHPKLPSSWPTYSVRQIPIQGGTIDLIVRSGDWRILVDGKPSKSAALSYESLRGQHHRIEVWCRP